MFLLSFPTIASISIASIVFSSFSVALYYLVHLSLTREISPETKKTADVVATRIGVIHAVVIGMMFTSVRMEYNEMIVAIESEASALTRLYNAIERQGGEELSDTKKQIMEYIRFVVEDQWPALREMKLRPSDHELLGRGVLNRLWKDLDKIEHKPGDLNLKELLDQVEDFRTQRLFDAKGKLLPVFWYIALIGFVLTLLTLYFPPPTLNRCLLVCFYSSMVAVVLLGIFVLTHPYSYAAGVNPDVFQWLLDASSG
ncbi:MAG: hypothetical protein U9N83_06560 [Thermodesulfobacteriota bacterium]|nr:hypothetical protein [Thermodesulfobacteriota bacterium]